MEEEKKPVIKKKKRIKNYDLFKVIGSGNYADVYLSIEYKTNKLYATKCISKDKLDSEDAQKSLRRELSILKKLDHKNIIKIIDYHESKSKYYIVLEYCNGGNLYQYVRDYRKKNNKLLNELYIQKLLQQIAPALEYMHKNNIIHRDMKLDNILLNFNSYPNVTKDGLPPEPLKFEDKSLGKNFSIKIADLGFAKDIEKDNLGSTVLGTPIYMSPDVLALNSGDSDKTYSTSSDLWSLGIITFELLTGTLPFQGKDINEISNNIKKGSYSISSEIKPSIEIISFINGLLQVDPEKRMNWEQIKAHDFLTKDVKEFTYVTLEQVDGQKDIKLDSNNLWKNFKFKGQKLEIGQINLKASLNQEAKKIIEEAEIKNEDIEKAAENEKIEKEKEKQFIKDMKIETEKKIKEGEEEKSKIEKSLEKLKKERDNLKLEQDKMLESIDPEKQKITTEQKNAITENDNKLEKVRKEVVEKEKKLKNIKNQLVEFNGVKNFSEEQIKENEEKENEIKEEDKKEGRKQVFQDKNHNKKVLNEIVKHIDINTDSKDNKIYEDWVEYSFEESKDSFEDNDIEELEIDQFYIDNQFSKINIKS